MVSHASPGRPVNSTCYARERDARVCWLLDTHPVTAAMLVAVGWFPSKNKALKRLRRLAARKRVRLVGTVCRKAGRPEHVYCRWRVKPDHLLHEVELTELCFRLHARKFIRGPHAVDGHVRPDAEVWIDGRVYYLELDRGSMGYRQLEGRFRTYAGCPHLSLWVCPTPERAEALRSRAGALRSTALFTTWAEAIADPHAAIWRDAGGGCAALPRHVGENGGAITRG